MYEDNNWNFYKMVPKSNEHYQDSVATLRTDAYTGYTFWDESRYDSAGGRNRRFHALTVYNKESYVGKNVSAFMIFQQRDYLDNTGLERAAGAFSVTLQQINQNPTNQAQGDVLLGNDKLKPGVIEDDRALTFLVSRDYGNRDTATISVYNRKSKGPKISLVSDKNWFEYYWFEYIDGVFRIYTANAANSPDAVEGAVKTKVFDSSDQGSPDIGMGSIDPNIPYYFQISYFGNGTYDRPYRNTAFYTTLKFKSWN